MMDRMVWVKSMTQNTPKLISLQDFLDSKERKEQELEFYRKKIEEIEQKMYWLNRELDLTNTIIKMIETESVPKIGDKK